MRMRAVAATGAVAAEAAVIALRCVWVCTLLTLIGACEGGTQTLQAQHLKPAQLVVVLIIEEEMPFFVCLIIRIFSKKATLAISH